MKASNVKSIITTEVPRAPPTTSSTMGTYQAAHIPTTLSQHDSLSVFNTEHLLVAHAKRSTLCLVDDTNKDQVVSVLLLMKSIPSAAIGLVETPILLSSSPVAVTIGHHFVVVERCYCTFDVATHALGPPPQPPWLEQREDRRLSFTFDPGITFRCEVQACMDNGRGNYDQIQVLVRTEVQYSIFVHCFLKEAIVEGSTLMDNDIWKGSSVAGIPLLKLWALQQQKSVFIPSFIRVVVFLWQSTPVIPVADCVYWCYWIVARCLQIDSDFADFPSESKKLLLKQEGEARLQVFEFQQYMYYMKLLDSVWSDVWLTSCTKNIQVTSDPGSWSYIQLVDKSKYLCKLLSVVAQQMLTCKNHCSVQERLSQVQLKGGKSNQSIKQCVTIELHRVYGNPCKLSFVPCTWTCYLLDSEDVPFNNGDWESLHFLWKTARHAKRILIFVASLAIVHFSAGMQNFKFIYLRRCTRGRGSVTDIQEGLAQCRQRKKIVAPTKSSMYLVSCRPEDFWSLDKVNTLCLLHGTSDTRTKYKLSSIHAKHAQYWSQHHQSTHECRVSLIHIALLIVLKVSGAQWLKPPETHCLCSEVAIHLNATEFIDFQDDQIHQHVSWRETVLVTKLPSITMHQPEFLIGKERVYVMGLNFRGAEAPWDPGGMCSWQRLGDKP